MFHQIKTYKPNSDKNKKCSIARQSLILVKFVKLFHEYFGKDYTDHLCRALFLQIGPLNKVCFDALFCSDQ